MLILGLNLFHSDSSACLLKDGELVGAVAEERLGKRIKHVAGFPSNAINSVLKMASAEMKDVDYVTFGHDNNANVGAKVKQVLRSPVKTASAVAHHLGRRGKMKNLHEVVAEGAGVKLSDCRFKLQMVEHHLAHVASSYFASSFDRAAAFSYDASGDFVSGMTAECAGSEIRVLKRAFLPHSLGFFYTAICQFIGFDLFGEEYKVMGLGAYGQPTHIDLMREIIQPTANGLYRLNPDYVQTFSNSFGDLADKDAAISLPAFYTDQLVERLGTPRERKGPITQRDKDLARSCQDHFEHLVLHCLTKLHEEVPTENLVTAGGCALNGVCNARILRDTPFRKSYIQCAASDDGTAIGSALYLWNSILKKPRSPEVDHAYWGPEYSEAEIEQALKKAGAPYRHHSREALLAAVAELLMQGKIVGWYQGRSEWGPRALGNRSILAHPGWPGMKDLINAKIKRRESFRPFAPSILASEVPNWFEQTVESPFMMHVVKIRPEKRAALAAVCHEDNTGRLHTVKRTQNALYHDLITEFFKRSGVPVVLNTSFNENEPIVDRPEHAVDCYLRTDIDALAIGPFVVTKPGVAPA